MEGIHSVLIKLVEADLGVVVPHIVGRCCAGVSPDRIIKKKAPEECPVKIEILGDGCTLCQDLKERTRKAVDELGIEATIESVMTPSRLAEYHAMSLPGMVIDGTMYEGVSGLSVEKIKGLLNTLNT